MRWIVVFLLPVFWCAEIMAAEYEASSCRPAQVAPHPVSDATPLPPMLLRSTETPKQVMLKIMMLELDTGKLRQLGFDFSKMGLDFSKSRSFKGSVNLNGLFEALREDKLARVLAEPTLIAEIGKPFKYHVGGKVLLWAPGPDGKPVQSPKRFGTLIDLTTQLTAKSDLRLDMRFECSELVPKHSVVVAGKKNPAIRERSVQTTLEMKFGETVVLSGLDPGDQTLAGNAPGPASAKKVTTVVLVTAEAVEPTVARQPIPNSTTSAR